MTDSDTNTLQILCFGVARDITGNSTITLQLPTRSGGGEPITVADLRATLLENYPAFAELVSFAIARNEAYASDTDPVLPTDTVAIIPPVSGG